MTQFKGTKGEWLVNPRASRNVRCNGITVANCSSGQNGDNEEEEKYNAKLISSALPMLELLENIVEYWNGDRNDGAMFDALNHIIFESEEMIKKATEL